MTNKRFFPFVIVSALSLAAPSVYAGCCGDGAVAAAGSLQAGGMMVSAISSSTVTVVTAIQTAAGALGQLMREGTAGIVGAIEGSMKISAVAMSDTMNQQKNLLLMGMAQNEKNRIQAEQSLSTLPSAYVTTQAGSVAGQGTVGASQVTSYANIALAKRHLTQKSGSGNEMDAYQNFTKFYAESGSMPNADILVDSLLAGASKSGSKEALTFTQPQLKAAQDYIANAVDVAPPADIPDSAANSVEGRRFRMMLRAEKAKMSLAFKSFADALAYRTPIPGFTGDALGASKGEISYQEFLTNEVRRRYNNGKWYAQVGGSTPTNLQREALFMQALELHLRMEESRHLEKIELQLAQMNMNQVVGGPLRQQIEQQRGRLSK